MENIKDLETKIEESFNILHKTRDFFSHCKTFFNNKLTQEEKSLITQIQIIKDSIHSFWVITVLELCKLVDDSPTQKHNLPRLLRDIRNSWDSLGLPKSFTLEVLQGIEDLINSTITSERILSIKTLRDKYYAHTDINNPNPEMELIPNFNKIESLIKDLEKILVELKSKIFDSTHVFVPVYQGDYLLLKDLLIGYNQNHPKK